MTDKNVNQLDTPIEIVPVFEELALVPNTPDEADRQLHRRRTDALHAPTEPPAVEVFAYVLSRTAVANGALLRESAQWRSISLHNHSEPYIPTQKVMLHPKSPRAVTVTKEGETSNEDQNSKSLGL